MPERLDRALAARGLAKSRTEAARLIDTGVVLVNGVPARKAAQPIDDATTITITAGPRWVSRAAHKLLAALETFAVDPCGRVALDLGASTGGFTQVLLRRGAAHVIALDVGHNQLDPLIRSDARVTVIEGENARYLTEQRLQHLAAGLRADLVVTDCSFISLRHILPAARAATPLGRDYLLLFKPQFEVGKAFVRGGLVTDTAVAADAATRVVAEANDLGLALVDAIPSPITGTHGNPEYLLWLRPEPTGSGDAQRKLRRMITEGNE